MKEIKAKHSITAHWPAICPQCGNKSLYFRRPVIVMSKDKVEASCDNCAENFMVVFDEEKD